MLAGDQTLQLEHGAAPLGSRAWLADCIRHYCITTADTQRIISPRGKEQNWLIDLRRLFVKADALEALAAIFYERFADEETFRLAGMETASIPLLTALALVGARMGKTVSVAIIRKERKRTGLGRSIEGELPNGPVTLIDDILHTGRSVEKARVVLAQAGARIARVFVVIDYRA